MNILIDKDKPQNGCGVGVLVALTVGVMFLVSIMMSFGGGSLVEGFKQGFSYLSLYGIMLIPVMLVIWLLVTGLCRVFNYRLVIMVAVLGATVMLIHSYLSSQPEAQLSRVTKIDDLPEMEYVEFKMYPSFSDGTTYSWVIICSGGELEDLIRVLKLERFTKGDKDIDLAIIRDNLELMRFKKYIDPEDGEVIYFGNKEGLVGGYDSAAKRFKLMWFPASRN